MKVLVLDNDAGRRERLGSALAMVGGEPEMHHVGSLAEAEDALSSGRLQFKVALVGPELPENQIAVVRFLRRYCPDAQVAAYDAFGLSDEIRLQRILLAGANMVFDVRMTPLKIALLLRPMLTSIGIERPLPSAYAA